MSYAALAYTYRQLNNSDPRQSATLLLAVVAGFLLAVEIDVGTLMGLFCVEAWFPFLGLIISDIFHAFFPRQSVANLQVLPIHTRCEKAMEP